MSWPTSASGFLKAGNVSTTGRMMMKFTNSVVNQKSQPSIAPPSKSTGLATKPTQPEAADAAAAMSAK